MATARDVITRALRKRKVLSSGESPTADELTDGLSDLNDMLAGWALDGIDFGHVSLAEGDTLDVPDSHMQAVVLSLAERLTDFGGQLDPVDVYQAEKGRAALRSQYFNLIDLSSDHLLSRSNLSTEN